MKVQYCSDLHLEFPENKHFLQQHPIKAEGDILVLAGDVVPFAAMHLHDDFFSFCSDNFQHTYWIPGNHEYYNSDIAFPLSVGSENLLPANNNHSFHYKIKQNVHLVNNFSTTHQNIQLTFSTLWSFIPPQHHFQVQKSVSDFRLIKNNGSNLTPVDFNNLHIDHFNYLKTELSRLSDKQHIVVTHHVPTLMHYPPQYKNSYINGAFVTELHDFISSISSHNNLPSYWIYGHHHTNTSIFNIGNVTMLTNQLGYVKQNEHQFFNQASLISI